MLKKREPVNNKNSITMKRTLLMRAVTPLLLAALTASTVWAEDVIIRTTDDWNRFATSVSEGASYEFQTVQLMADIPTADERANGISAITKMAGVSDKPFKGNFNGNGHAIKVALSGGGEGLALFYEINSATIRNLKVTGSINSSNHRPATFTSFVIGNSTIKNCWSSVDIVSTRTSSWVDCGAMVARVSEGVTLKMTDCLFTGTITYNGGTSGGGMVGFTQNGATATLTNCLYSPTALSLTSSAYNPRIFVCGDGTGNLINCYYNAVAKASTALTNEGIDASDMSAEQLAAALGAGWAAQIVPFMNAVDVVTDLGTLTGNYTAQDGEILTNTPGGHYKVSIADGATVTLKDVYILPESDTYYTYAGITCLGDATIILAEGSSNWVRGHSPYLPGISVPEGKTLRIKGPGTLRVEPNESTNSGAGAAGIGAGGFNEFHCGNIIIEGGNITATGTGYFCGIGGGRYKRCGNITICGGRVTATGSKYAAGIGTGDTGCSCGDITITDDVISVTAIKGANARRSVGIGYSTPGATISCGTITIGGTVYSDGISESTFIYTPWKVVSLADGTAYTYAADHYASNAIYTKTIEADRVGKHQAWLLPFDYTISNTDLQKFNFYKINMIVNAPTPGENGSSDQMWVFLTKLDQMGTVLHANMPYVIKAKEVVTDYEFQTMNTMMKGKNTGVILKTETAEDIYSFYATYDNTSASESDPFYYISASGKICLGTSVTVGPYRWIVRKTNKFGNTTNYVSEMRFFDNEEDDDATAITEVTEMTDASTWYDLNGRRLQGKPAQKGIYIHNGRKEIVK